MRKIGKTDRPKTERQAAAAITEKGGTAGERTVKAAEIMPAVSEVSQKAAAKCGRKTAETALITEGAETITIKADAFITKITEKAEPEPRELPESRKRTRSNRT